MGDMGSFNIANKHTPRSGNNRKHVKRNPNRERMTQKSKRRNRK